MTGPRYAVISGTIKGGVTRLLETNYIHHRGHLSLEQEQALDTEHLNITAKSVVAYVKERWGIHYNESGMTTCSIVSVMSTKSKQVPGKADAQAQEAFLEDYEKLKENQNKENVILLMDAVHPQHNPLMHSI